MKQLFKSFCVAFSLYSKIPMPHFNWASKDMEYHLIFFPLVGAVIGALELLWWLFCSAFNIESSAFINLTAIAIPVLVTGGFHIDGFMDTMDALHSYQPKEKKLEILKDPHIGAFSVIGLITFFMLAIAFSFEIKSKEALAALCFSFVLSRILSGLSVMVFPKAKKDGMAVTESKTNAKKTVTVILLSELIAVSAVLIYCTFTFAKIYYGIVLLCGFAFTFAYYYFMSKKHFGGITGDLAGFFVCTSELVSLIAVSVCCILGE